MRDLLVVDDDHALLEGLRDALRPYRREWAVRFVDSGAAALAALEEREADVVVSDLRMPGMDGAELLAAVAERRPETGRIVLSGQADVDTIVRASAVAHRLLAKPCATEDLVRVVARTCVLSDLAHEVEMRRAVVGACELPAAPPAYLELAALLEDPSAGVADAAEIVRRDPALSAKLLQLANSAFVGYRGTVVDVRQAVSVVGLRALSGLALSGGAADRLAAPPVPGFPEDALRQRSFLVARVASLILRRGPDADDAFAAGLLLDVGLLVMAAQEPELLAGIVAEAVETGRTIAEVERERGGVHHAAVGAHLLAMWGVPAQIVDAVAHHSTPSEVPEPTLDVTAATHLAEAVVDEVAPDPLLGGAGLDPGFIATLGVGDRLDGWLQATRELVGA